MMAEIETGGPAFPSHGSMGEVVHDGATLRDYFAAKAMQGICAHHETWGMTIEGVSIQSYHMADAMLAARSKP